MQKLPVKKLPLAADLPPVNDRPAFARAMTAFLDARGQLLPAPLELRAAAVAARGYVNDRNKNGGAAASVSTWFQFAREAVSA
jgi:hypothetical protein